jgi:hypothetical protein
MQMHFARACQTPEVRKAVYLPSFPPLFSMGRKWVCERHNLWKHHHPKRRCFITVISVKVAAELFGGIKDLSKYLLSCVNQPS